MVSGRMNKMAGRNAPQHDETAAEYEYPKSNPCKSNPGRNSPDNEGRPDPSRQSTEVDVLQCLPSGESLEGNNLSRGAFLIVLSWPIERNSNLHHTSKNL